MARRRIDCIADIKARWNVTSNEYEQICVAFQGALKKSGIWGQRMQGMATLQALREGIESVLRMRRFQSRFSNIDQALLQNDFRKLAQVLSRNERRRSERSQRRVQRKQAMVPSNVQQSVSRTGPPLPSLPLAAIPPSSSTEPSFDWFPPGLTPSSRPVSAVLVPTTQSPVLAFESSTIIVRRQRGEVWIYRPRDFCAARRGSEPIEVDHLSFEKFISTLSTNIGYAYGADTLKYQSPNEGWIAVPNETGWKAALWDMYHQGNRQLRFVIQGST